VESCQSWFIGLVLKTDVVSSTRVRISLFPPPFYLERLLFKGSQVHAIRGAQQLSGRAHASSPCLNSNHKDLDTNKGVVVLEEAATIWCVIEVEMEVICWATASPCVEPRCRRHSKRFHTSRTSFPFTFNNCYEMCIVCNDGMLRAGKLRARSW
jgi:hypothetical protein